MALRTILVCLNDTKSALDVLQSAAVLARRDNAHVIALLVKESLVVYPGIAMHIPEESYDYFLTSQRALTKEMKEIFDAHEKTVEFPIEWRDVSCGGGYPADKFIESARNVDLVVVPQDDNGIDQSLGNNMQERIIKESGRPVLMIPRGYSAEHLGDTVLMGWSETREATRAVHDMLTVASPDADIRIIRIGKPPSETLADHAALDLAAAIARHGPKVEINYRDKDGDKVPDILGQEAFEMGADMIVTGAFGHSRVYDFVIGAATRALLNDAKLPVLFSK